MVKSMIVCENFYGQKGLFDLSQTTDFETKLNNEIEKRIEIMETPGHVFSKRFSKRDYIIVGIIVISCLALIIIGAFL